MRRLNRGPCPPELLAVGAAELTAARAHFLQQGFEDGFDFTAYSHKPVKIALGEISSYKCAYCEADYDVTQPVDVEHYRPKSAVDTNNGRVRPGYWWLAAKWENLLPSCIRCNRVESLALFDGTTAKCGKGNFFPLLDETLRATHEHGETQETPLLIDPFVEDPAEYIRFADDSGWCIAVPVALDPESIEAKKARASIDFYGLNRAGLVRDRSRYMQRAQFTLARLEKWVRRLDRLPPNAAVEQAEVVEDINAELDQLDQLMSGEDRFTGMLIALVSPKLTELNLAL